MTEDVGNAPDPDSSNFLEEQNTVDKQSPAEMTADEAGNEPGVLDDDPPESDGESPA